MRTTESECCVGVLPCEKQALKCIGVLIGQDGVYMYTGKVSAGNVAVLDWLARGPHGVEAHGSILAFLRRVCMFSPETGFLRH